MHPLGFFILVLLAVLCGTLIRDIVRYQDPLTRKGFPSHLRMTAIFGTMFIALGFNGGSPYLLMAGLAICISCDIYILSVRKRELW